LNVHGFMTAQVRVMACLLVRRFTVIVFQERRVSIIEVNSSAHMIY